MSRIWRLTFGTSAGRSRHPAGAYRQRLQDFEKKLIQEALDEHAWNLSAAARTLEMTRTTLRSKLKSLSIHPPR